jgi:thiol-disulfide isomerase/thioredoxin
MQSYYEKYLKYKAKYLDLKNSSQYGAGLLVDQYANKDFSWFEEKPNREVREKVLAELDSRLLKHESITDTQLITYYSALDAKYYRNKLCDSHIKSCPEDAAVAVILAKRLLQATTQNQKGFFEKYAFNIYQHVSNLSGGGQEKPQIYLFKADWCGHCKGFKPLWEKLQKEHSNKYEFITVDADKNKKEISEWGIKGFPTIIKKVSNNAEEYVGPRDEASVVSFIEAN